MKVVDHFIDTWTPAVHHYEESAFRDSLKGMLGEVFDEIENRTPVGQSLGAVRSVRFELGCERKT